MKKVKKKLIVGLILLIVFILAVAGVLIYFQITKSLSGKAVITLPKDRQGLSQFQPQTALKSFLPSKTINKIYESDAVLNPAINRQVSTLSISGEVSFKSDAGLVRVVAVDRNNKEYLVYESYLIIASNEAFKIDNLCEETCLLNSVYPASLKIYITDATFKLNKINYQVSSGTKSATKSAEIESNRQNLKLSQEDYKVQEMNEMISEKGGLWVAGKTSVSHLTYEEKKKLFSNPDRTPVDELPNLQGFEYYKGGIFEIKQTNAEKSAVKSGEEAKDYSEYHSADTNKNWAIEAFELSRVIGFYNAGQYHCNHYTIDSFAPGAGVHTCRHHDADTNKDWAIGPTELSRVIGFYNAGGYHVDPMTADGFAPGKSIELPDSWDWRNVSGENWMTSVKNQGSVGTCKFFAELGSLESNINLYFNQHLDLDLSEQLLNNCELPLSFGFSFFNINNIFPEYSSNHLEIFYYQLGEFITPHTFSDFIKYEGVPDESCNPYTPSNPDPSLCSYLSICSNLKERVWKSKYFIKYTIAPYIICDKDGDNCIDYNSPSQQSIPYLIKGIDENYLRMSILQDGPINSGIKSWNHGMSLIGYNYSTWIFKNSWGENWGDSGYGKLSIPFNDLIYAFLTRGPFTPPTDHSYWPAGFDNTIKCVDNDGDTYCNWGISEQKPNTCPAFCKAQKDCDDSNAHLGPFISEYNLNCKSI